MIGRLRTWMGVTILAASRGNVGLAPSSLLFTTNPIPNTTLSAATKLLTLRVFAREWWTSPRSARKVCASVSAPNIEADIHEARKPPPDVRPQDTTNPRDIYIYIEVGHTCAT